MAQKKPPHPEGVSVFVRSRVLGDPNGSGSYELVETKTRLRNRLPAFSALAKALAMAWEEIRWEYL